MKLIISAIIAALLIGGALARAQAPESSARTNLLVVRTLGDSVAITVTPDAATCHRLALAVIPPAKSNRERYSIVSAECFQ
jgi:hypothetical protein